MASLFPREEHAEALFHRILSNPGAEQQLYETFCMEQENASFEDGGGAECSFAKALLQSCTLQKRFCRLTRTAIFPR